LNGVNYIENLMDDTGTSFREKVSKPMEQPIIKATRVASPEPDEEPQPTQQAEEPKEEEKEEPAVEQPAPEEEEVKIEEEPAPEPVVE
jgi:hypothetical protein